MFGAPLVRATIMHQQHRPSVSNLPPSSAVHATIMSNMASQSAKTANKDAAAAAAAAAKPVSKHVDMDPQMFIDSPFVGGATLSPASSHVSTARSHTKGKNGSFDLKFFNPSDDPRLFAMHM